MQLHTIVNMLVIQPWDPHTVDNWRREIKWIQFFFFIPRGHHFKMSCWGCEFLPDPHPHPLCLEANPLISCVSMDLQGTFFIWEWKDKEGEERKSASFSVLFYMHFKIAAVLLYFVHKWWFESYVGLNKKRLSLVGQPQKPETITPLQCSYVDCSFPCYSFF